LSTTPSPARRVRRRSTVRSAAAAAAVLALTAGCGGDVEQLYEDALSFGFPDPVTDRAESVFSLWLGSTAAALVVGAFVTALILFAVFRYRKTSDDLPRQVRYNLPVEVLYTVVPFVIIAVLFYYTVVSQNTVNDLTTEAEGGADVLEITVVGFQWNWQFQHTEAGVQVTGSPDQNALPQLVLPVGQKIRVVEESPDVIHSFYVPKFLFKRDVVPGRLNTFEFTIEKEGEYIGRCAEFCGERHYAMNFSVLAVTPEEYDSYIAALQDDPDAEILTPGAPAPGTEEQESSS
jgi:cytochrome c oxidase subunit 2